MLSQIERGQFTPAVTILWKIAIGLKPPLSYFLERPQAEYTIVNPDQADMPHTYQNLSGDGCTVYNTQSPAKIGLVKLNERDISLIWWVFGRWTM